MRGVIASACLGLAGARGAPVPPVEKITPATAWQDVFTRTSGWIGGDGVASVVLRAAPDRSPRLLWLFGDSGIGSVVSGKWGPGCTMVNNVAAIQVLPEPKGEGIPAPSVGDVAFHWGQPIGDGKPRALFTPARDGEWYWPVGGGIDLDAGGHRLYLFMARLFRPREKDDGVWNFEGRGSDLLIIDEPTADPGAWRPRIVPTPGAVGPDLLPARRRITWGTSVCADPAAEGQLYIFGVDATDGFNKKAVVARSAARDFGDPSAWTYWSGADWIPRLADAAPIVPHVMDEFSVWAAQGAGAEGRFLMIYSEELLGRHILARAARHPWGPWSEPRAIYECSEPGTDKRLLVYSAKAHPEVSGSEGLLVSYCVNSTDFWHMVSDATISRPRFVRVPYSMLPEAPAEPE